jgi:hypothetical protein
MRGDLSGIAKLLELYPFPGPDSQIKGMVFSPWAY